VTNQTKMDAEIRSIPAAATRLLDKGSALADELGTMLAHRDPDVVTTVARGSSDHAAAYLKYAIELTCGIPVASTGPSISSVYNAPMRLTNGATFAISQSGKSPDIVSMAQAAKHGGSAVISFTNASTSPLALVSGNNFDICAGPELSVAATKTFVLSILAGLMVVGRWKQDDKLLAALADLPEKFQQALNCDWTSLADRICKGQQKTGSLYVLGRGPSYAIAKECALKFKETCQIHAEAYSAAEVMHGPVSIAQAGFPILVLASPDASHSSIVSAADDLSLRGVDVFITSKESDSKQLPHVDAGHPLVTPLIRVVSFYQFVEKLAARTGLNPDQPPHLRKVTETV